MSVTEPSHRGPHHRRLEPEPTFVALCELADRWGLHLFLTVRPGRPLGQTGREWRLLDELSVGSQPDRPVIAAKVGSGAIGLQLAAQRVLDRLEDA